MSYNSTGHNTARENKVKTNELKLFQERVAALRVNPSAIERIVIHDPNGDTIQNMRGNEASLQIYTAIVSNDGYIGPAGAKKGLAVYSNSLRDKAKEQPGSYPEIVRLEKIVRSKKAVRCDVIRRDSFRPVPERILRVLQQALREYPTPFYIYDEQGIRDTARAYKKAFAWVKPDYKNYFAVKACPNPHIVSILKEEGFGADCSSLAELVIAEKLGMSGEDIMFTSNDTPAEEYIKAKQLGAIINLDDLSHIGYLDKNAGMPGLICFRYNPGPLRKGNDFIGDPRESKYGVTTGQIPGAYIKAMELGAERFGLHTMVVSNMLDEQYLEETAVMLFKLAAMISRDTGIKFDFINLGGGFGIPYKPEQSAIDLVTLSAGIRIAYQKYIKDMGLGPVRIVTECGRAITGPHGFLVSKVRHVSRKYKDFVGLDACMANLMRPALYGAYHHITVLGKENEPKDNVYDVTGSLCENNDKFAVNRPLPAVAPGDVFILHDAGAHGYAMGFQYNGKLRCAELLVTSGGKVRRIRRAEALDDYLGTVENWP
jgi:diaminopimelate decarboxylase